MNTSRRDLLKYFSIGAVIAPVVAGEVRVEEAARLIEVPKVEIVDAVRIKPLSPMPMAAMMNARLVLELDGRTREFPVTQLTWTNQFIDTTLHSDSDYWSSIRPTGEFTWVAEGRGWRNV